MVYCMKFLILQIHIPTYLTATPSPHDLASVLVCISGCVCVVSGEMTAGTAGQPAMAASIYTTKPHTALP